MKERSDETLIVPRDAPVRAAAETRIMAPADVVWATLADLNTWPEWNPEVEAMSFADRLTPGARFRWKAGGLSISSKLRDIESPRVLSWTGRTLGLRARHIWRFEETDGITRVQTEESFDGLLARLLKGPLSRMLATTLERGLEALGRESERRTAEGDGR